MVKSERAELPEEVLAACSEMKAEWRKSLANHNLRRSATERTIAHIRAPISANVRMTRSESTPLADPGFLITFESKRSGNPNLSISREPVLAVAAGSRSVGTIKAELHSVFKKLGVRTRTELAVTLRG